MKNVYDKVWVSEQIDLYINLFNYLFVDLQTSPSGLEHSQTKPHCETARSREKYSL